MRIGDVIPEEAAYPNEGSLAFLVHVIALFEPLFLYENHAHHKTTQNS